MNLSGGFFILSKNKKFIALLQRIFSYYGQVRNIYLPLADLPRRGTA